MEDVNDSKLKRFCSRNILIILGIFSVILMIALIAVGLVQNKPLPENVKYGIVLDAGSSHTTLYIYKWPAEKENDTGEVNQIEECQLKGPGISKYAQKLGEIGTYLTECMEKARKVIPKSRHEETPVYLGATAGMRLLREENEQSADKVLDMVTQSLSNYPFNFQGARIISGTEEGAYGWITINYLLGKFITKLTWFNLMPNENDSQETYGALDLGGASTQITFVPQNQSIESPQNALYFRLYGKNYSIYTHSFLCYGKDQALLQKLAKDMQVTTGVLQDPCFNYGYNKEMNISELYNSPCTRKFKMSLPFHVLKIQGTGNFEQCQESIFDLFSTIHCPYSHCSFNEIFLPPLHGQFVAFSAYYYVMKFLNLTSEEAPSEEKVTNTVRKFCSRPWEELKINFGDAKEKYLSEYCFSGTYILSLLQRGYHFTPDFWNNIHFMGKIRDSDVGWTLGYMLNLTNMIPAEQPLSAPLPHSTYIFLMVLFSLILVAVFLTVFLIIHKPSCFWQKDMV